MLFVCFDFQLFAFFSVVLVVIERNYESVVAGHTTYKEGVSGLSLLGGQREWEKFFEIVGNI